jgi:hypothetical protein
MQQYRLKPPVFTAEQYTPDGPVPQGVVFRDLPADGEVPATTAPFLATSAGLVRVVAGDYVVTADSGGQALVSATAFADSYEQVPE